MQLRDNAQEIDKRNINIKKNVEKTKEREKKGGGGLPKGIFVNTSKRID